MSLVIWTSSDKQFYNKSIGFVLTQGSTIPMSVVSTMTTFPPVKQGDVVLACGSKALAVLQGLGVVPKNRTIASLRGRQFTHFGAVVYLTYDPMIVNRDYARLPEIQWDTQLARRVVLTGSPRPVLGVYRYVESLHEIIERVEELYEKTGKPVDVACDLETKGLIPYIEDAWIITCQFTVDAGSADVVYFEKGECPTAPLPWVSEEEMTYWEGLWTQLNWLFTSPKISLRGANFKYDSTWIRHKWGIEVTNFKFDTMLVGSLLDENRCVVPSTRLLTSDLRWVQAGDAKVGDVLLGFDEDTPSIGSNRSLVESVVLSTEVIQKRCRRVVLSNGQEIVVSNNHQFLSDQYGHHNLLWRHAISLKPGDRIRVVSPSPYDFGSTSDFDRGRLSGFLDGEGTSYKANKEWGAWAVTWGQKPGVVQDDMKRILSELGVEFGEHDDNTNVCKTVRMKGSWNCLKVLMATLPPRLLDKKMWLGSALPREPKEVMVVSIEDVGVQDVVALETSTSTFIAEGLASHNSNSLKLHAKIMTNLGGYEDDIAKYDMGSLEVVPKRELVNYAGGDTDATLQISIKMKEEILKDRKLANFYVKLLQPASRVFQKMERIGVLIDRAYFRQLEGTLTNEINHLHQQMLQCLPNKLRIKYKDDIATALKEGKSPFKPKILLEFLFTPSGLNLKPQMFTAKTKAPSTAMEHLMMFAGNQDAAPFITGYKELGSASKTLNTFVQGFMKHLRDDGRFHPTYFLARGDYGNDDSGTITGRCLTGDSMVVTGRGEVSLNQVVVNDTVLTHTGAWRTVTETVCNGMKWVYKVVTPCGAIRATGNHPVLTTIGWVVVSELRVGFHQLICYNTSSTIGGMYGDLEGCNGVSRLSNIQSREDTVCIQPEGALCRIEERVGGDRGVQGLYFGESRRDEGNMRSQVGSIDVSSSSGGEGGGEALGWESVEQRSREFGMGDFQAERRGHDSTWKVNQRIEKCSCQADPTRSEVNCNGCSSDVIGGSGRKVEDCKGYCMENQERTSLGFGVTNVLSVTVGGVEETYDISVEEDHSFIANGLVVHNTSASDPAIQTLPKHSKWAKILRKGYIAPEGMEIMSVDYSQGELRICAVVAEEPTMIAAYQAGADLHTLTAAQLNGYDFDEFMQLPEEQREELRYGGKAGNFGLIYGMQHKGFREYAFATYGVVMTDEEAYIKREKFFELYSRLLPWHDKYKKIAHQYQMVRSPLGRIRHLPLIASKDNDIVAQSERQAINSPIQSCLSDMMQLAMVYIDIEYGHVLQPFMMTHDSLTMYVPAGESMIWAKKVKEIMENLPLVRDFDWHSPLKFYADAEAGMNLGEMKKLKGL